MVIGTIDIQIKRNDIKFVISGLLNIEKGTVPETKNISETTIWKRMNTQPRNRFDTLMCEYFVLSFLQIGHINFRYFTL